MTVKDNYPVLVLARDFSIFLDKMHRGYISITYRHYKPGFSLENGLKMSIWLISIFRYSVRKTCQNTPEK
jgi:hypothetical protein